MNKLIIFQSPIYTSLSILTPITHRFVFNSTYFEEGDIIITTENNEEFDEYKRNCKELPCDTIVTLKRDPWGVPSTAQLRDFNVKWLDVLDRHLGDELDSVDFMTHLDVYDIQRISNLCIACGLAPFPMTSVKGKNHTYKPISRDKIIHCVYASAGDRKNSLTGVIIFNPDSTYDLALADPRALPEIKDRLGDYDYVGENPWLIKRLLK